MVAPYVVPLATSLISKFFGPKEEKVDPGQYGYQSQNTPLLDTKMTQMLLQGLPKAPGYSFNGVNYGGGGIPLTGVSRIQGPGSVQQNINPGNVSFDPSQMNMTFGEMGNFINQQQNRPLGYDPSAVMGMEQNARSDSAEASDVTQRALQARYGGAGFRGGVAAQAGLVAARNAQKDLAGKLNEIRMGAADATLKDRQTRDALIDQMLGRRGTMAQQQAELGLTSSKETANLQMRAQELMQQGRFEDAKNLLQTAELNAKGDMFNAGVANTAAQWANEAPQNDWKTMFDAYRNAFGSLSGSSNTAGSNALMAQKQADERYNNELTGWGQIAQGVQSAYSDQANNRQYQQLIDALRQSRQQSAPFQYSSPVNRNDLYTGYNLRY